MLSRTLVVAAVIAVLSGCDKPADSRAGAAQKAPDAASTGASQTPSTPANLPAPSTQEKREGASPVQGQVDPKEGEQRRDFQQKGDGAGPKASDTAPSK